MKFVTFFFCLLSDSDWRATANWSEIDIAHRKLTQRRSIWGIDHDAQVNGGPRNAVSDQFRYDVAREEVDQNQHFGELTSQDFFPESNDDIVGQIRKSRLDLLLQFEDQGVMQETGE